MDYQQPDSTDNSKMLPNFSQRHQREQVERPPVERGGCLTVFLVFFITIDALLFVMLLNPRIWSGEQDVLQIGIVALEIIGIIGVWNWKRLGVIGIVICRVAVMLSHLLEGSLPGLIGSLVFLGIFYYLIRNRWHEFV